VLLTWGVRQLNDIEGGAGGTGVCLMKKWREGSNQKTKSTLETLGLGERESVHVIIKKRKASKITINGGQTMKNQKKETKEGGKNRLNTKKGRLERGRGTDGRID